MLIVTGVIEVAPAGIDDARNLVRWMMIETRKEKGCLAYRISQVTGQENCFCLYEEWRDQTALDAHFATPHIARFRKTLDEIGVLSRDVYRVVGDEKCPLI